MAVITEHHRLGDLNNRRVFFTGLEAGCQHGGARADSTPGSQRVAFSLYSHIVGRERERRRENALVPSSPYKDTNAIKGALPL